MPQAPFTALMTMSVAVRTATIERTQFGNIKVTAVAAIADSPISALIQPLSTSSRQDAFAGRWPEATHRMYCATGVTLDVDYLLSWDDPEGNTSWGFIIGMPENAGGQAHHYEIPVQEIQAPPSGVT